MPGIDKTFQALSDPSRIRILKMLEVRPLCVCEITAILDLATSTVSKHLSILREAGFIRDEKEGKWVNYSLNRNGADPHVLLLLALVQQWGESAEKVPQDRERLDGVDRYLICCTPTAANDSLKDELN